MKQSLFFLFILICFQSNDAKKMWGSRRKEDEDVPVGFQESARRASVANDDGFDLSSLSLGEGGNSDSISTFKNFLETYVVMMEKLVDSQEFDTMITPDMFKNIFQKIPRIANFPQIEELLESPSFQDPVKLKETIREGLKQMRIYMSQIIQTMHDPQKLQTLIGQLPADLQDAIVKLVSGDMSALKDMIGNLPGVTEAQKNMLSAMVEGDSSGLADTMQQMFSDPDQVEAARQQFLADPSMAASLGIPEDVLHNKRKWAKFMKDSMNALDANGDAGAAARTLSGLSA